MHFPCKLSFSVLEYLSVERTLLHPIHYFNSLDVSKISSVRLSYSLIRCRLIYALLLLRCSLRSGCVLNCFLWSRWRSRTLVLLLQLVFLFTFTNTIIFYHLYLFLFCVHLCITCCRNGATFTVSLYPVFRQVVPY